MIGYVVMHPRIRCRLAPRLGCFIIQRSALMALTVACLAIETLMRLAQLAFPTSVAAC